MPRSASAARKMERGCQPSGEMASAPQIGAAPVFDPAGVVRVAGSGRVGKVNIILNFHIPVRNEDAQGRPGCPALPDAADDAKGVGLYPGGGDVAPGTTEVQLMRNGPFVHGKTGPKPVHHAADLRAVAFTEQGEGDVASKNVVHRTSLAGLTTGRLRAAIFETKMQQSPYVFFISVRSICLNSSKEAFRKVNRPISGTVTISTPPSMAFLS